MTQTTQKDLIRVLAGVNFPEQYWSICDGHQRHSVVQPHRPSAREDLIAAFEGLEVATKYDARDRSISIELGQVGERTWTGVLSAQRSGLLELALFGRGENNTIGDNFAVLAYDAKRHADPSFTRDRFSVSNPPYPRPFHNGDGGELNRPGSVGGCLV